MGIIKKNKSLFKENIWLRWKLNIQKNELVVESGHGREKRCNNQLLISTVSRWTLG
uniref:Uncharacterized protein n=1 Tax=Arion vulgaris TaxID=1028688 RepID=A0A0B6YEB6_9EUPU